MQEEIFYDELSTPYDYSYSPYTKIWYADAHEQIPEPDVEPEELSKFKLHDELGDWAIWEGDEKYYDYDEEKEEFHKYVKYICGEKDLWSYDSYSASILFESEKQKKYAHISVHEFINLEKFLKNIDAQDFSSIYIEAYTGIKLFVWKKENNKIRFVVQQYGLGSGGYIDYDLLTIGYDVIIDKNEFVNEFMRFINKYKNLLFEKIKEYEKEHNIKFSNPMNIPYINHWLEKI